MMSVGGRGAQQRDFEKARRMQYSPAIILKSSFHLQTTPVGFEPTRGDPIGLAGRRLNRSAKVSLLLQRGGWL